MRVSMELQSADNELASHLAKFQERATVELLSIFQFGPLLLTSFIALVDLLDLLSPGLAASVGASVRPGIRLLAAVTVFCCALLPIGAATVLYRSRPPEFLGRYRFWRWVLPISASPVLFGVTWYPHSGQRLGLVLYVVGVLLCVLVYLRIWKTTSVTLCRLIAPEEPSLGS